MEKSQLTGASLVLLIAGLGGSLPAWADGSTTVGGKIYTDITNISSTPKSSGDGFGVDVKRFYFGADHTFDDQWSANITTDFTHGSAGEKTQVFVKKAYFQYKISDTATLRMGSADMPWIPYAEHAYGFRYVEPTLVDKFEKGSTSADWGLHLMGKTDMVDYQVSLVNGSGYASLNRSKSMDISARLGLHPVQGLTLAIGGRSGKHGSELQGGPSVNTASRLNLLAGYKTDQFNVAVEYFTDKNMASQAIGSEDKANGVALYGNYNLNEDGKVFVRFDNVKPNKDTSPDKKINYFNVGYEFVPRKGVNMAVVYKHLENKSSAGTLKSDEFGLWAQVAF